MDIPVEDIEIAVEDGEVSLEDRVNCRKAKGHCEMIPVGKFTVDSLPPAWQRPDVWLRIMHFVSHAVKIKIPYISDKRPKGYLFYDKRGQNFPTCGSGYLADIDLKDLIKKTPIDCPLKQCNKEDPHKVTPIFNVWTANHVIFDDTEAQVATVDFFYDSEGARVVTAEVDRVEMSQIDQDSCILCCVCHDLDLFKKIVLHKVACAIWWWLNSTTLITASSKKEKCPLVVVIGHPHGCPKHISLGDWVGYQEGMNYNLDMKVRDLLHDIEPVFPSCRETGVSRAFGVYFSPDAIRDVHRAVEANPDITLGEHFKEPAQVLHFNFITYTAATCPGSSGGAVIVGVEGGGRLVYSVGGTHFRGKGKEEGTFINACGMFGISHRGVDVNVFKSKHMKSVREEKK